MRNVLLELRAGKGWSQAALAEKLRVSRQTVDALETGRHAPSLPLAFSIGRLIRCSPRAHRVPSCPCPARS